MIFETTFSEVIHRTSHVKSFRFEKPDGFEYEAGQFMYVTIETFGGRMMKHFTISSSPSESYLEFTKKLTESDFSKSLVAVKAGDWVGVDGPYGSFTLEPDQSKIAMLCGGIGITAFRSMIKYWFDYDLDNDIVLLYSCSTFDEIIFREELDEMARKRDGLRVFYTLTREEDWWEGERGRIDGEKMRRIIPNYKEVFYYICGPQAMVEDVTATLKSVGAPDNRIKKELFSGY
jgi:ferredoxin-NADP reductase